MELLAAWLSSLTNRQRGHSDGRCPTQQEGRKPMTDLKTLAIGALAVAVIVLGYMVYEKDQRTISIELPKVKMGGQL